MALSQGSKQCDIDVAPRHGDVAIASDVGLPNHSTASRQVLAQQLL